MALTSSAFWFALGSIILTNIVLSGDNAVVIALAARNLPKRQQKQAIFWGSAGAIVLRVVLTALAVKLLALPYLKTIGAVLLVARLDHRDDVLRWWVAHNVVRAVGFQRQQQSLRLHIGSPARSTSPSAQYIAGARTDTLTSVRSMPL